MDLQNRSDQKHIYSNVLPQYKFDQEEFKYNYSVKELVLLTIAANNKLAEKYQGGLFVEGNLSLLLIASQKYIEAFIEKFHGTGRIYNRLKIKLYNLLNLIRLASFQ
ncbi:hypothetical protein [Wolbachia endosymbiont of Mansonella perstans]|uniref:hypothetical protein n=1 Tax=Wolbachia endosymbiont of Mansonella perstans TaxID=229526 RepID=UPI001CE1677D|nr:hypothetical protein [Wolbachia endosymbiont of Mansonella perstans]MCA4773890.1 hypothetical protein [Wolbachia endosymbiont of Mansonella perstans]